MRKQMLAVMVGLSVVLSGCSMQSTESMLQDVKKNTKEIKSGKLITSMYSTDKVYKPIGYNISGYEKFDQIEYNLKGTFKDKGKDTNIELYIKDGVKYIKFNDGSRYRWSKNKLKPSGSEPFNFKKNAFNMKDSILNLLDNKDNWDVTKDGDKVTFKLKKNDETKRKVEEEYLKTVNNNGKAVKFSEFDFTIEYVLNMKTKNIEKIAYEIIGGSDDYSKIISKGSLEEINKEVKVEVPEEAKKALEKKA